MREVADIKRDLREIRDKQAAIRAIERLGIDPMSVMYCPCELTRDNKIVFRYFEKVGPIIRGVSVPILQARVPPLSLRLVGFMYPDGSLRKDAEMLCSVGIGHGFGGIVTPTFVILRKPSAVAVRH